MPRREDAGVRRAPSPRGEEGARRHIFTWKAPLPGSAVSQLRVAMDGHTVTQSLGTGQGEGRSPWPKERFLYRLLQPTAPPDPRLPLSLLETSQSVSARSIYKQRGMGIEGAGRLRQQTTELEGRNLSILNAHLKC